MNRETKVPVPRARVMLFVHDLRTSGVVRNTLAIAAKLAERHDVTIVARHAAGYLFDQAASDPRWRLVTLGEGATPPAWPVSIWRLRQVIARLAPDVVMSTGNLGHWQLRLALATFRPWSAAKAPLRAYRISNAIDRAGSGRAGWRGWSARALAADADLLFLVGGAIGATPQFADALAEGRAEVVTNGVDRERALALAAADPPGWPTGTDPVVLGIGRLVAQKDFATLVRAAARASRTTPLRLVILGKGGPDERAALTELAAAEGLGDRFLLAGEHDNVFAWLGRAGAFVLSSRWEGSPMALREALAVGTPVVATRQAGDAAAVLDDGRYGLLVDAGDVDAMAAAIRRQLSPDAVRPGNRIATFDVKATVARYAAGIDRLVRQAKAGPATVGERPSGRPARRPALNTPASWA